MGYLVCGKCGGYYRLEEGESPESYSEVCDCGGKTIYYDDIPLNIVYKKCSACGYEDKEEAGIKFPPLTYWCPNCNRIKVEIKDECPICGFKDKSIGKPLFSAIYGCPKCGNSFGYVYKQETQENPQSLGYKIIGIISIVTAIAYVVLMLIKAYLKFNS